MKPQMWTFPSYRIERTVTTTVAIKMCETVNKKKKPKTIKNIKGHIAITALKLDVAEE